MDIDSPPSEPTYIDKDYHVDISNDTPLLTARRNRVDTPPSSPTNEPHKIPLQQYIPLGCFTFKPADVATSEGGVDIISHDAELPWVELTDFLPEVQSPEVPWKSLIDLWRARWIRIEASPFSLARPQRCWRIYVLPDDVARTSIDRINQRLRKALAHVLETIDISPDTWKDGPSIHQPQSFDVWTSGEDRSLFYLFNTLPSPKPSIEAVRDTYSKVAMRELLDSTKKPRGLQAILYPYQQRSAAMMLQREVAPERQLDPRLEARTTPSGVVYYYGARDRIFLREPRYYDSVRGGILAETMGLGKTVMVLALVIATKDHWPKTPDIYEASNSVVHPRVPSLFDLTAATVSRLALPYRRILKGMELRDEFDLEHLKQKIDQHVPSYEIPPVPVRTSRRLTFSIPPEKVRLCHGTIIVVPRNLIHQWQSEIEKHIEADTLKVLLMDNTKKILPPADELATYDVILFSRNRFEAEAKKGIEDYVSPLKGLHWLRIVIDEGHNFSSWNTNAAVVAEKFIRAERRWIVSGTPAKDLLGVEMDVESLTFEGNSEDIDELRRNSLEQRKDFSSQQEATSGAIKSLGAVASKFLKSEPWAASGSTNSDTAKWEDYIYRHEAHTAKTFTSFSACLRRTLENLVVKTRPEDVEQDVALPPLTHKIIKLEPCVFDRLTSNLFVQLFTSNAVTSERVDVDYLFHKASNKHLHALVANLRQSGFYWPGFQYEAIVGTLGVSQAYLEKPKMEKNCTNKDERLLRDGMDAARMALQSLYWQALSLTQEMGMFIKNWPADSAESWAFDSCTNPMMMGLTEAVKAQKYANNVLADDPSVSGLAAAGIAAKAATQEDILQEAIKYQKGDNHTKMVKGAIPSSAFLSDTTRIGVNGVPKDSPKKQKHAKQGGAGAAMSPISHINSSSPSTTPTRSETTSQTHKHGHKRRLSTGSTSVELAPDSALGRTAIVGTTSSKFSYLIDRVITLQHEEKILIFFDANYQAYYLSQVFDLLHIKHLIFTSSLSGEHRSKYVVLFNEDSNHRVLLMDIKQAAHGLNISSASRVFFISPACSPNIEAQAMKRAHRIGQTKSVHAETLILQGSIEEAMHERAEKMTRNEHIQAAKFLEDDLTITRIIQKARVQPITPDQMQGAAMMAPLQVPQQIFGRPGRGGAKVTGLEKELFGDDDEDCVTNTASSSKRSRKIPASRSRLTVNTARNTKANAKSQAGRSVHTATPPANHAPDRTDSATQARTPSRPSVRFALDDAPTA